MDVAVMHLSSIFPFSHHASLSLLFSLPLFLSYHPPSLITFALSLSSRCPSSPLRSCFPLYWFVLPLKGLHFSLSLSLSPALSGVCCGIGWGHQASFMEVRGQRCVTTFGIWGFCKCVGGLGVCVWEEGQGKLRFLWLNTCFGGLTQSITEGVA